KEFLSVSVSDPRPTVNQVLALAPMVAGLVNSLVPESKFEVGLLPNAHEVSRHLFPNVSVVSTRGDTRRLETRAGLAPPRGLGKADSLTARRLLAAFRMGIK